MKSNLGIYMGADRISSRRRHVYRRYEVAYTWLGIRESIGYSNYDFKLVIL